MAYVPTLQDTDEAMANQQPAAAYTPTLADTIQALNQPQVSAAQANPTLLSRMVNNPFTQGVLGAGDALQNTMADVANLLPGVNAPLAHTGSGTAYDVGRFAGNTAAFMGGGEGLEAARAAAEGIPMAGKLAEALGQSGFGSGLAKRALGASAYGAVTNPNDRLLGAGEGALFSGAADLVPGAASLGGKIFNAIRPQQYAEQIMSGLGGGQTLEGNAQSLAKDIQNAFMQRKAEGNALYNPIFSSLGDTPLYPAISAQDGQYAPVANELIQNGSYERNLQKLHNNFISNPTLNNAHALQSQLGTSIRKLQSADAKGNLDIANRSAMQGYQDAQGALKSDINNFLNTQSPNLANQYNLANSNWAQNVVPYIENPKIAQISKGDVTNPRNISTLFKNPEPETQKVVDDLGQPGINKILYSELGKTQANLTPDSLSKAFSTLDNKGLGAYVTPDLEQQMDILGRRTKMRNIAQMGVGGLLGASSMHSLGAVLPSVEIGAGLLSGLSSPYLIRGLRQKFPTEQMSNAIANGARASYSPLTKALLANIIPGAQ